MNPFEDINPAAIVAPIITSLTPDGFNEIQDKLKAGATLQIVPAGSKGIIIRTTISPELVAEVAEVTLKLQTVAGITDQATATEANKILKRAKALVKDLESDRKRMDGPLNAIKAENKAAEDTIIANLQELALVVNQNITRFQAAEEEKARKRAAELEAARQAELQAAANERARVAKIKDMILAFERNCLNAMQTATVEDIDKKITQLAAVKLSPEVYQEFTPEAEELLITLKAQFQTRKSELTRLAVLQKENAEMAAELAAKQAQEAAERAAELKAKQEKEAEERADKELNDTANIQMGHELKTSLNTGAKGVQKRWTFDEDTIDMTLLPAEYLTYDKAKITAAIAAGLHEIPGVNIYQKIINVSR